MDVQSLVTATEGVESIGPVDPASFLRGPNAEGWVTDLANNPIIRVGLVNDSVCVKCLVHIKCFQKMPQWQMPSRHELLSWALADAPDAETELSRGPHETESTEAHMRQLRTIRASAQWPGRTYACVIAEAAAADP